MSALSGLFNVAGPALESGFNFANQAVGGIFSAATQLIGQQQLRDAIPATNQKMHRTASAAADANRRVAEPLNERTRGRMDAATTGFRNTDEGQQAEQFAADRTGDITKMDQDFAAADQQHRINTAKAEQQYDDIASIADALIADNAMDIARSRTTFEGDRKATLDSMKKDIAENMQSIRGGHDTMIQTSVQEAIVALNEDGRMGDPLARLEASSRIQSTYARQLGEQAGMLRADYNKRVAETNLTLTAQRQEMENSIRTSRISASDVAGGMKVKAATDVNLVRDSHAKSIESMATNRIGQAGQARRDIVETWKAYQETAIQKAAANNQTDMEAGVLEMQINSDHAAQMLAIDRLEFEGHQNLAGMVAATEWSVPTMNMTESMAAMRSASNSGGGGDSGSSFSMPLQVGLPSPFPTAKTS